MRNSGEHGDMTCRQHSLRPRRPIVELQQVPKRGIEHRPGRRPFIALEARHPCRGAAPSVEVLLPVSRCCSQDGAVGTEVTRVPFFDPSKERPKTAL